jgi:hypothetical protein
MGTKSLPIDDLRLDLRNPRIADATSQREALQKIINDQDVKLVALAESITEDGLNPMDRLLLLASPDEPKKFIVIEGNRRLAALKILQNPAVLTGLEVRPSVQKRLEVLAAGFDAKLVEPVDCFEVAAREDGAMWIQQRHTGENAGRGIVDWSGIATARFRGNDPALQALDFVLAYGELTDNEKAEIGNRFPISTLDRLLSTPAVRNLIGLEIKAGKLLTGLPLLEAIKPLRRIVRDLGSGVKKVTDLKLQPQMVAYVESLGIDLPDLAQLSTTTQPVEDLKPTRAGGATGGAGGSSGGAGAGSGAHGSSTGTGAAGKKSRTAVRRALIPKGCALNVTNSKIAEIAKELRALALSEYPHAISVLLRVFLELSVDHYLNRNGIDLKITPTSGGRKVDKSLKTKVTEAVDHMVAAGVPKKELDGIRKASSDKNSPLHVDTLHNYVHNAFYSPTERDLTVAWDNGQPFFERLWP